MTLVISIGLCDSEGNRSGKKRYAVTSKEPMVSASWSSNRDIPCQGDQQWDLRVWERIEERGYVAELDGASQWSNRGDHGIYVGTGDTAEAALLDAYGRGDYEDYEGPPPQTLVSACRQYDSTVSEPPVQ